MISGSTEKISCIHFSSLEKDALTVAAYTLRGCGNWLYYPQRAQDIHNYRALADTFGIQPKDMVRPWQKDTVNVLTAGKAYGGYGILREPPAPFADALITDCPGLMLCLIVSDCAPLYLLDSRRRAIGLAHCGRKCIAAGMVEKTVMALHDAYGCQARDLMAVIGPHICADCYEVDQTTGEEFASHFDPGIREDIMTERTGHIHLNFGAAIRHDLLNAGLTANSISESEYCNLHNQNLFYSYRGGDGYHSDLAVLMLQK